MKVIVNFQNPLLQAQEICKTITTKLGEKSFEMFESLQDKGFITKFDYNMEPYNNGYEITFEAKCNFEAYQKGTPLEVANKMSGVHGVYVYPCNFFNHKLKEGSASFEARTIDGEYIYIDVNSVDDFEKSLATLVQRNASQVDEFLSKL